MIGSLINFISSKNQILSNQKKIHSNQCLLHLVYSRTNIRIKDKRLRYKAYQERSIKALNGFKKY